MKVTFAAALSLTLTLSSLAFAGGAVVAGGRLTLLGDSKYRILAALDATRDLSSAISAIQILEDGSVKVSLVKNRQCEATIYDIARIGGASGAPTYTAENPQQADCD